MPRKFHKKKKLLPAERAALERARQEREEKRKAYEEHLDYEERKHDRINRMKGNINHARNKP